MSSLPFFWVLDRWTTFARLDFGIVEVRLGYEGGLVEGSVWWRFAGFEGETF